MRNLSSLFNVFLQVSPTGGDLEGANAFVGVITNKPTPQKPLSPYPPLLSAISPISPSNLIHPTAS